MSTIYEVREQHKRNIQAMRDSTTSQSEAIADCISAWLHAYLDSHDMTLSELARITGISRGYLYQVREGNSNITIKKFWLLCKVLGVNLMDILPPTGGTDG